MTNLFDAFFRSDITGLHQMAGDFDIAVHDQSFIRTIRVDADSSSVEYWLRGGASLPGSFYFVLEHARIGSLTHKLIMKRLPSIGAHHRSTYPNDNSFRRVSHDGVSGVTAMSLKADGQVEETLVRIGFSFLPHVVGCCFIEMQPSNRDFGDLVLLQLHPGTCKTWHTPSLGRMYDVQLTKQDEKVSCFGRSVTVRPE